MQILLSNFSFLSQCNMLQFYTDISIIIILYDKFYFYQIKFS